MTPADRSCSLEQLTFDNRFTRDLPADPLATNARRQVRLSCYSRVAPTPVVGPRLVAHSREVADLLGIPAEMATSEEFAQVFAGNRVLKGMDPFAMCYGGHQFGNWAGQLGDGRAINLGELVTPNDQRWTLQLKGAGPTPYSRTADGLAVLRSSVREFLCSEAMHHLGVPTTRALSLCLTGEKVMRDMFYNGNPQAEPGAVVCRVAQSFLRFGNFEILNSRNDLETNRRLVEFTIRNDFPHLGEATSETIARWFHEVCERTATMIIHWMRVGFVHGVMNTDNMSILGLTIDYGPYGWVEDYNPGWTPNTTDASGRRYCFGNQPKIAMWNLAQLGNALIPLVGEVEPFQKGIEAYSAAYELGRETMWGQKLGITSFKSTDTPLAEELFSLLGMAETDMTLFFRALARLDTQTEPAPAKVQALVEEAFYSPGALKGDLLAKWTDWFCRYQDRLKADGLADGIRKERMNAVNPKYVLRNYLAQEAIDLAEQGDFGRIQELLDVLRLPYDEQPGREPFAQKRPDWARHRAGCSMLSCSS